jgi:hypothetical protein
MAPRVGKRRSTESVGPYADDPLERRDACEREGHVFLLETFDGAADLWPCDRCARVIPRDNARAMMRARGQL